MGSLTSLACLYVRLLHSFVCVCACTHVPTEACWVCAYLLSILRALTRASLKWPLYKNIRSGRPTINIVSSVYVIDWDRSRSWLFSFRHTHWVLLADSLVKHSHIQCSRLCAPASQEKHLCINDVFCTYWWSHIISMKKTGEHFLLVYDKGCFAIHCITVEEAKISPVSKVKWMWLFFRHVNLYLKGSSD